ncbi:FHA domain-containing protein [Clostridium senegalense]|nr:FHA domain-containing protein [Clostridium senegalense]MBU5226433.1 FHA domain-containing protein [Clostridium senegalense]
MPMANFSFIFKIIIVIIIYCIIFYALKIMYKDVKNEGKKKPRKTSRLKFGLEIVKQGQNPNLQEGSVIPLNEQLTMGRAEDNTVVLKDKYASSHHIKIYMKNGEYILEDLKSTNGTFVNDRAVSNKIALKKGYIIKIGSSEFKVIN